MPGTSPWSLGRRRACNLEKTSDRAKGHTYTGVFTPPTSAMTLIIYNFTTCYLACKWDWFQKQKLYKKYTQKSIIPPTSLCIFSPLHCPTFSLGNMLYHCIILDSFFLSFFGKIKQISCICIFSSFIHKGSIVYVVCMLLFFAFVT